MENMYWSKQRPVTPGVLYLIWIKMKIWDSVYIYYYISRGLWWVWWRDIFHTIDYLTTIPKTFNILSSMEASVHLRITGLGYYYITTAYGRKIRYQVYATGGRFDRMGPLACLSPFPVLCWIRSDKYPNLRFSLLQCPHLFNGLYY